MECIQLSLFGRMSPELSVLTAEKISAPCWKNLPAWNNQTLQFLDLRGGDSVGNEPGQSSETDGVWLGDSWTVNISEWPSVESVSLLSSTLEVNAPERYYLSARACQGILTRASRRGKKLPDLLQNRSAGNDRVVGAGCFCKGDGNTDCGRTKANGAGKGEAEERTCGDKCREATAYSLKIRSGCAGGGKGALVQTEKNWDAIDTPRPNAFPADY